MQAFDLTSLDTLDGGRVLVAFRQALARCVTDCKDRPAEDKPRKIILQAEVIPVMDDRGDCDEVKLSFQIKDAIPTRKSRRYSMGVRKVRKDGVDQPQLVYSTESPENVNQKDLGFDIQGE